MEHRRPTLTYDDLLISIRRAGTDHEELYHAQVQQSGLLAEGGPFRRRETFSVTDVQELRQAYDRAIEDFHVLAPLGIAAPPPDIQRLLDLGRRVGGLLPPGSQRSIVQARVRARRHRRGLRITIEVTPDAQALLAVPWELITLSSPLPLVEGGNESPPAIPLLLNEEVSWARQMKNVGRYQAAGFTFPLRVQAVAAQPVDAKPITIQPLLDALQSLVAAGTAEVFADKGTLAALAERVRLRQPEILHLLCHGEQADTGRQLRSTLLFTHADGCSHRVGMFDLAPILSQGRDIRMVVLQACHGAAERLDRERAATESIALGLLRFGVPVVVAFQGEVGQKAAAAFTHTLYDGLMHSVPVDQAVAAGRIAMQAAGGVADWSLPVVYYGSEREEVRTPWSWLADTIERGLRDRRVLGTLRGALAGCALLLIVAGLMQAVAGSPPALLQPPVARWLAVWTGTGLIGPAVIAAAHCGVRQRASVDSRTRAAALVAQWAGAFMGYAAWGCLGLGCLAALHVSGVLGLLPDWGQHALFVMVLSCTLVMSYTSTRMYLKSVLAMMPEYPQLFGIQQEWIVFVGAAVLLTAPTLLAWLVASSVPWLAGPVAGAFLLALGCITTVIFHLR